jgi:hypothetical protein
MFSFKCRRLLLQLVRPLWKSKDKKIGIFDPKYKKISFTAVIFFNFWSSKPWIRNWIRIRIRISIRIRIRISIRICIDPMHTVLNPQKTNA